MNRKKLYQITLEELLSKKPELNNISSDLLKYHYEGREKLRKDLLKIVKEEKKNYKRRRSYKKTKKIKDFGGMRA